MSFRTMTNIAIISLSTWQAASAQSGKETNTPISCDDADTRWQYNETRGQMNDHESIQAINSVATFTPTGQQTNPNFGAYNTSRTPRIMQLSVRVNF